MTVSRFILALDQGTTSSRAVLFDQAGRVRGIEQQEFPQHYPQPGWVEHAPEDLWSSQIGVAERLMRANGLRAENIEAIGITNQRETTALWERATGRPVANAIVWQDRRTAPLCDALREAGHGPQIKAKTGLPLDPYFSGTKIRWLLDNVPGLRARAENGEIAFGTVDSFLLWRLTGGAVHATDVSNASRTLLFDIGAGAWDDELLALMRIPAAILPKVRPSCGVFGETDPALFGAPIPIAGIAGDQQAATFGQACLTPGMVKNTYGTGSFLLMNTGNTPRASKHGLLTTALWNGVAGAPAAESSKPAQSPYRERADTRIPEYPNTGAAPDPSGEAPHSANTGSPLTYALEGSVFVTGAAVQWLRDELQIVRSASEIETLAASVPDSGGVVFVPAFAGLGAPYWDAYARGAIVGLTRGTGRAHIARAALEAVCFQTMDVLEAMRADSGLAIPDLRVDGGMTVNNLLMQMQADILGIAVVRPTVTETTALGAACLAGLAVGYWSGIEEITANWSVDRAFAPRIGADEREALASRWRRAVNRVKSAS